MREDFAEVRPSTGEGELLRLTKALNTDMEVGKHKGRDSCGKPL